MDFRIVWTAPALEDLEALVRYIAQDDSTAAVRVGDKIVDHVSVSASFPEIGPVVIRSNNAASVDAPVASLLHIVAVCRRATDQRRSPTRLAESVYRK